MDMEEIGVLLIYFHLLFLVKLSFSSEYFLEEAEDALRNMLTCNITKDMENMFKKFAGRSKKVEQYFKCKQNQKDIKGQSFINCLKIFRKNCSENAVIAIKTIRTPLYMAEKLFREVNNLQLLYLLRDPRATIKSAQGFGWVPRNLEKAGREHCRMVMDDARALKILKSKYPERIKTLLFEDLASDTLNYAQSIYNFLGIPLTKDVNGRILEMTSQGTTNDCGSDCTIKANSKLEAFDWRLTSDYNHMKIIDSMCFEVYAEFGYKIIRSKEHFLNVTDALWATKDLFT